MRGQHMSRRPRHQWISARVGYGFQARIKPARIVPFHRLLRVEQLEDRRLLATITVDTLTDGIGVPGTSLREAISQAAPNDTIKFSVNGTITLGALGQLSIDKNLTINGPGSGLLTVKAFDPTPATKNGDGSRIFNIDDANAALKTVSISGLTLTGGDLNGKGGAIFSAENLTLASSVLSGNSTSDANLNNGGAIY